MKIVLFISVFLLVLTLAGCKDPVSVPETSSTVAFLSQADAITLYQQATAPYRMLDSYCYTIASSKKFTVGDNTFYQTSTQALSCQALSSETIAVSTQEVLQIDDSEITLTGQYANQTGYLSINGITFASSMSADAYLSRYVPLLLFDTSAYAEITANISNTSVQINFSKPVCAETWALPEDAQLVDAFGQATLDTSNTLLESTYTIIYTHQNTVMEWTVTTSMDPAEPEVQSPPPNETDVIPVAQEVFEIPKILEQVCGYLLQAETVKSTTTNTVTCQVGGIYRCQTTQLELSNPSGLAAEVNTSVDFINYNQSGEISRHEQVETFQQNRYTICVNGEPAQDSADISAEEMLSYCQEALIQNILLPNHIADIRCTMQEGVYHLTFSISDDLVQKLIENTGYTLYDNPSFFQELSDTCQTVSAFCCLAVEKHTGLPESAGIFLDVSHQIEESNYSLCVDIQQSFQFS